MFFINVKRCKHDQIYVSLTWSHAVKRFLDVFKHLLKIIKINQFQQTFINKFAIGFDDHSKAVPRYKIFKRCK